MEEKIKELEAIIEKRKEDIREMAKICEFFMKENQRLKEMLYEKVWKEIENDINSKT